MNDVLSALAGLTEPVYPSLGVDLDGCCDDHNLFFRVLTASWPGKVFVLTFRDDRAKAEEDLACCGIRYDELILVSSFEEKAEVIVEKGILAYFDDQPEMLKTVPPDRTVMLVRNEGNFDFEDQRWVLSDATGKLI